MKFSRLIEKAEKFGDKVKQGRQVKPKKLAELQRLLGDKIARYEARLKEDMTKQKRSKLETRLKVVMAQLKKSKQLQVTR
jgi:predicted component of type VI protein secretion system